MRGLWDSLAPTLLTLFLTDPYLFQKKICFSNPKCLTYFIMENEPNVIKLAKSVVQDLSHLDKSFNFADKSILYLNQKKEWSFGDYLLIAFNIVNVGFCVVKTIDDGEKLVNALMQPLPQLQPRRTQIPARNYLSVRKRVKVKVRRLKPTTRYIRNSRPN